MQTSLTLYKKMEKMTTVFETVAITCARSMLQKSAEIVEPWKVVDHLNGEYEFLVTMGCANSEFKSLILVGVNQDSLLHLLDDDEIDMSYLADVLGEFVNSYCALLDDNEEYSVNFGKQIQAVPLLYRGGAPFVSFLWGIQGRLRIGDGEMYLGYVTQYKEDRIEEGFDGE